MCPALLSGSSAVPGIPESHDAVGIPANMLRQRPDVQSRGNAGPGTKCPGRHGARQSSIRASALRGSLGLAAAGGTDTTRTGDSGFGELFRADSLTYSDRSVLCLAFSELRENPQQHSGTGCPPAADVDCNIGKRLFRRHAKSRMPWPAFVGAQEQGEILARDRNCRTPIDRYFAITLQRRLCRLPARPGCTAVTVYPAATLCRPIRVTLPSAHLLRYTGVWVVAGKPWAGQGLCGYGNS